VEGEARGLVRFDPFKFTEQDGFFYRGVGTSDNKDGATSIVHGAAADAAGELQTNRDLILALTAWRRSGNRLKRRRMAVEDHRRAGEREFSA